MEATFTSSWSEGSEMFVLRWKRQRIEGVGTVAEIVSDIIVVQNVSPY